MLATAGRCINLVDNVFDSSFTSCSTDVQKLVSDFGNCQRRVAVYEASWLNNTIYDPCISPGSANQCILVDVYLRSNLSRNLQCNLHSNVLDHISQLLQSVTEYMCPCRMHSATCLKHTLTGKVPSAQYVQHARHHRKIHRYPVTTPVRV